MFSLRRFLPFLRWFPVTRETLKADLVGGITVALVLVPQSMAYAQLAGLPAYYGLYAAFLPGIVAAMWGSSAQLATGPVAVVSLLTASGLSSFAAAGTEQFIALAILMSLIVGLIQLLLGMFKLGMIVNFLSHPVILGFTNAAAIIIGLSQLNKLLGVSMDRSDQFIRDVWEVLAMIGHAHIPTLLFGVSAFVLMWVIRRIEPRLPSVLIAVSLTTIVSWAIGFEHNGEGSIEQIMDSEVRLLADEYSNTEDRISKINDAISSKNQALLLIQKEHEGSSQRIAALDYEIVLLRLELKDAEIENRQRAVSLRKFIFERVAADDGQPARLYLHGEVPSGEVPDGYRWRIKKVSQGQLKLVGGGEVVGAIPSGLPPVSLPGFNWDMILNLFTTALVISLVGFMEAISIAKAIAAKTKVHIDPNQELIGQGLGNIVGSLSSSYPVSGSFSRSAVNLNAGSKSGMSSVITGLIVLITLLFLTPLLYHLPQAVLAAVIMMAVVGLINFGAIKHAWHAHKHDGIAAVVTFVATLAFAPHLDNGIMIGAGLALILYLYRTMRPRVAILGRHHDGTLRDARVNQLQTAEHIVAIRYDGQLYFANVPYFENTIMMAVEQKPEACYLLVVADGINSLDASGEEAMRLIVERLRAGGVEVIFSGLKRQVLDVMKRTGLFDYIGEDNMFLNEDRALDELHRRLVSTGATCAEDGHLLGERMEAEDLSEYRFSRRPSES
jgi:sulfate permease, SulP family